MKKTILSITIFICAIFSQAQTQSSNAQPKIYVEKNTIEYGIITKGADGNRSIKIYNKGNAPLLITNCSAPCGCTTPACPREPIMPGQLATVTVHYNTNLVGNFSKNFSIMSNDPDKPGLEIIIKGEVKEILKD